MRQAILAIVFLSAVQTIHAAPAQALVSPTKSLVTVNQNDEKENLLGDSFSRTLYVFDPDQGSNTSVCTGDCAEVWPPYIISSAEAKVLVAPLGSVVRANKKLQLTYNGRPLYTYMLDREVGQDLGDGIGNVWHYIEVTAK